MRMLKRLFFLCMIVFLAGCGAKTKVAVMDEKVIGHKNIHVVFVGDDVEDPRNVGDMLAETFAEYGISAEVQNSKKATDQLSSGSGFVVAEGYWLTNNHVIKDLNPITVSVIGANYPAEVVAKDPYLDLALLKGPTGDLRPFAVGEASIGKNIFVIGYPVPDLLGSQARVTSGLISSLYGIEGNSKNIQISAPIQPGNSGGPVVSEDWKLVGVAVSSASTIENANRMGVLLQGLNFAVSPNHVKGFLLQNGIIQQGECVESLRDALASTGLIWNGSVAKMKKNYLATYAYDYYWDLGYHIKKLNIVFMDSSTGEVVLKSTTKNKAFGFETAIRQATKEILLKLGLIKD